MPQAEPVKGREVGIAAIDHGKQVSGGARRVRVQLRRQVGRVTDTEKQRHPDGKRRVGGNGIGSAFKTEALADKFGIERRHHQAGPAGDISIHGGGNHRQACDALLSVEGTPDEGARQRRGLALVARDRHLNLIGRGFGAAPELCRPAVIDKASIKRFPGGNKPRVGIEVAQPDRRLHRRIGKGIEAGGVDIGMRGIHQHDVKRLEERRVDRPRVGVVQQLCDQRGKDGVIDPHRGQDVGGKLRAGGIAHGGAADDFGLVPERLKGTADLIHHRAARLVVATGHQLGLDKPLLPFKPRRLVGKLADQCLQRLRPAARRHPVQSGGDQRIGVIRRAGGRNRALRDHVMRQ